MGRDDGALQLLQSLRVTADSILTAPTGWLSTCDPGLFVDQSAGVGHTCFRTISQPVVSRQSRRVPMSPGAFRRVSAADDHVRPYYNLDRRIKRF